MADEEQDDVGLYRHVSDTDALAAWQASGASPLGHFYGIEDPESARVFDELNDIKRGHERMAFAVWGAGAGVAEDPFIWVPFGMFARCEIPIEVLRSLEARGLMESDRDGFLWRAKALTEETKAEIRTKLQKG